MDERKLVYSGAIRFDKAHNYGVFVYDNDDVVITNEDTGEMIYDSGALA